mgnify:CR=1 FL=1
MRSSIWEERGVCTEELFKEFKKKGVPVECVYCCDMSGNHTCPELFENEFIVLKADQSSKKTQLGRVEKDDPKA